MSRTSCPALWLPARPLSSSGAAHNAERTLGQRLTGCSTSTYAVLRFDSAPALHVFLDQRVTDGVIRRMIDKWPKARTVEDGLLRRTMELPASGRDPCLLEHLPAPCARRMVRERGEAATQRGLHLSHPLLPTTRSWRSTASSTPAVSWRCWASVLRGMRLTLHPDKTRLVDFRPQQSRGRTTSADGWDHLRLPGPRPMSGAGLRNGRAMVRQITAKSRFARCGGRGERLVPETPALVTSRPASPPLFDDAGPLRLLRRRRQHSTTAMVRQPSRADLAQVVVSARSPRLGPMGPLNEILDRHPLPAAKIFHPYAAVSEPLA